MHAGPIYYDAHTMMFTKTKIVQKLVLEDLFAAKLLWKSASRAIISLKSLTVAPITPRHENKSDKVHAP
jgi:hypothetical protein